MTHGNFYLTSDAMQWDDFFFYCINLMFISTNNNVKIFQEENLPKLIEE